MGDGGVASTIFFFFLFVFLFLLVCSITWISAVPRSTDCIVSQPNVSNAFHSWAKPINQWKWKSNRGNTINQSMVVGKESYSYSIYKYVYINLLGLSISSGSCSNVISSSKICCGNYLYESHFLWWNRLESKLVLSRHSLPYIYALWSNSTYLISPNYMNEIAFVHRKRRRRFERSREGLLGIGTDGNG